MGVYIKGMEMPPQGEFKHVRIYDDGDVTVEVDTGKEVYEAVIANAVSVPPHGRLIDADALSSKLTDLAECEWNQSTGTTWAEAFEEVDGFVQDAPTIIEAEGRET